MTKVLFVYNPNAGQRLIKNSLWDILNVFAKANYELSIYPTKSNKDGYNYIKENAHKFERIIVSGGDGTLNEAVSAYMELEHRPPLGYIPAGTTNDFAVSLNIPKDMVEAAELIVGSNEIFNIDVGLFNNNHFDYVAAFGAFTDTAYSTPQDMKNLLGHLAYIFKGLRSIRDIRSYEVTLTCDGEKYRGRYIFGMITNTLTIGGLLKLDPEKVSLDDGQFEVILVKTPKDPVDLARIGGNLLDDSLETDLVTRIKCSNISVDCDEEISWTLDGEYGGTINHVDIKVLNKALPLIK